MAVEKYYNIDNENDITSWWCPAYDDWYKNLGYGQKYEQGYTKVKIEIPHAVDVLQNIIGDYWSLPPSGMTKFSTTRDFLITYDPFLPSPATEKSMKVYLNQEEIPYTMITSTAFRVPADVNDGYLWVEYIPAGLEATVGDKRDSLKRVRLEVELVLPEIRVDTIFRIRETVNNMEKYFCIIPTRWIGGATNALLSGAQNLIKTKSPVYKDHLTELRSAIGRIENEFDTRVPISLARYRFTSIDYSYIYMIQYIEELMEAIVNIEAVIIDPNYYGG
jgi:hypothetical protein